jgi:hypothetical protein
MMMRENQKESSELVDLNVDPNITNTAKPTAIDTVIITFDFIIYLATFSLDTNNHSPAAAVIAAQPVEVLL